MVRIVVVGGGLVGLAAALLLARDGTDVTVLERDMPSRTVTRCLGLTEGPRSTRSLTTF